MSPLDSKLILDALDKLFAEQNAKWDRRFADLLAPWGRAQAAREQRDATAEPRVEQPAQDLEERELDLSAIDAFGSTQIRNECGLSSIVPVVPLDVVHKPAIVSDATSTDGCIDSVLPDSDLHRTHPVDFDCLSILPDVILCDIVSRLPIMEATRTAVLSRRWRPLCVAPSVSLVHSNPVLLRRFPKFPKGTIYDNDGVCVDTAADELLRLTNRAGKPTIVREKVPIEAKPVFLAVQIKQAAIRSAHAICQTDGN